MKAIIKAMIKTAAAIAIAGIILAGIVNITKWMNATRNYAPLAIVAAAAVFMLIFWIIYTFEVMD